MNRKSRNKLLPIISICTLKITVQLQAMYCQHYKMINSHGIKCKNKFSKTQDSNSNIYQTAIPNKYPLITNPKFHSLTLSLHNNSPISKTLPQKPYLSKKRNPFPNKPKTNSTSITCTTIQITILRISPVIHLRVLNNKPRNSWFIDIRTGPNII